MLMGGGGSAVPAMVLMRAGVRPLDGTCSSPAGELRGVAPVDVVSSSPRIRCLQRMIHAALQRGWSSIVSSRRLSVSFRLAGAAVKRIAAADRPREASGFFCVFSFTQGFFCKFGQLSSFWMYLMFI